MAGAYFRSWEPLLPPTGLASGSLLVLSPHPDDEVIGAGGLVLGHRMAGERVEVAIMTDGRLGDPGGDTSDAYAALRRQECEAAARILDTAATHFLDYPDGSLATFWQQSDDRPIRCLRDLLEKLGLDTLAMPSPYELHPDHKATLLFGLAAWKAAGCRERLLLYEVGSLMPCNALLDITALAGRKEEALKAYQSQLAHHDITAKVRALEVARCANVPDPAVTRCEGYIEVKPESADEFISLVDQLLELSDGMKPELKSD